MKDQGGYPYIVKPDSCVIVIPKSGEFRTPNIEPFFSWHQVRIEYEDGRVVKDMSRDVDAAHGVKVEDRGIEGGRRQIGPSSSESSTDYDGTTIRLEVVASP